MKIKPFNEQKKKTTHEGKGKKEGKIITFHATYFVEFTITQLIIYIKVYAYSRLYGFSMRKFSREAVM